MQPRGDAAGILLNASPAMLRTIESIVRFVPDIEVAIGHLAHKGTVLYHGPITTGVALVQARACCTSSLIHSANAWTSGRCMASGSVTR